MEGRRRQLTAAAPAVVAGRDSCYGCQLIQRAERCNEQVITRESNASSVALQNFALWILWQSLTWGVMIIVQSWNHWSLRVKAMGAMSTVVIMTEVYSGAAATETKQTQ